MAARNIRLCNGDTRMHIWRNLFHNLIKAQTSHGVTFQIYFSPQTAEPVEPKEAQPLPQGIQASPSPWALFPGTTKLSICLVDLMFYIITSLRFDEAHICCKFST